MCGVQEKIETRQDEAKRQGSPKEGCRQAGK